MSGLKSYTYPGAGEWLSNFLGYSQAVRVGDRIECSGQGGWEIKDNAPSFPKDIGSEIELAFKNVDTALRAAGGKGWPQVFRVNSYHMEVTEEVSQIMSEQFKKWMPDHRAIWTEIGVRQLGAPDMRVEIEVSAHDPEGASSA